MSTLDKVEMKPFSPIRKEEVNGTKSGVIFICWDEENDFHNGRT